MLSTALQQDPVPAAFPYTIVPSERSSQDTITGTMDELNPLVSMILSTDI